MHLFFRQACALAFRSLPLAGVLSALLFSSAAMGATYSFSFVSNEYMKSMYGTFTTAPATGSYLGAESVVSGEIQGGATIMTNGGKDFVEVRYWGDVVSGGPSQNNATSFPPSSYTPSWYVPYDNLLFPAGNAGPGFDPNGSGVAGSSYLDAYGVMFTGIYFNIFDASYSQQYFLSVHGSKTTAGGYEATMYDSSGTVINSQVYAPATGVGSGDPPMTLGNVPEIDPATGSSALSLVVGVLAMVEQRRRRGLKAALAG